MKKVALVTCYFHHNYGSMLQAYATQKIITKLGYENVTITCKAPINYMVQPKWKYYIKKLIIGDWKLKYGKIKIAYYKNKYKDTFGKDSILRENLFYQFANTQFNLSPYYSTRNELIRAASNYGAFIVGSDQLWRTDSVEHDYYTLGFVPDNILKIAYSTSFGITKVPDFQVKKNKWFLNRLDYISVREKSGSKIVKDLTGRNVPVVLDPTLLFDQKDWMCIQEKEAKIKEPYILCYFLGNNPSYWSYVMSLKKSTGCKIVGLLHLDEYIKDLDQKVDIAAYDVGPREFLNLIRNASYICTDSFHCTVFSIINERLFFTFNRFSSKNIQSTNTRIDNLLSLVGLEDRRRTGKENADIDKDIAIEYKEVFVKLEKLRISSLDYLKESLKSISIC